MLSFCSFTRPPSSWYAHTIAVGSPIAARECPIETDDVPHSGSLQTSTHSLLGTIAASFIGRQRDGAVGASARRIDHVEPAQGLVEIDIALVFHAKGTHATDGMTDALLRLVGRQHLRLAPEARLELRIRYARVSGAHHERHPIAHRKRKRLGYALGLATDRLGGKLHRGARCLEFQDVPVTPVFGEILLCPL